jgi:hypothetical protein
MSRPPFGVNRLWYDSRAMEQPTQQVVPAETHAMPQYRGAGGWLLFFIFSLTIITPAFQCYIAYNEWTQYNAAPSSVLFNVFAVDLSMRAILIVFGIYAGIQLWRVKPGAPRIAKTYLMAIFVQQIVLVLIGLWTVSKVAAGPENIGNVIIQPVRSFIYVAIWYAYLNRSRRVASTYQDFSPNPVA